MAVYGKIEAPSSKNDRAQSKSNARQLSVTLHNEERERRLVAVLLEDGTFHVSVREGDMIVTLARGELKKAL